MGWGGSARLPCCLPPVLQLPQHRALSPALRRDGDRRWSCSRLVTKMDFSAAWCGQRCSRWHCREWGTLPPRLPASRGGGALPYFLRGAADRGRAEHRDLLQPLFWWPGGRGWPTAPPFPLRCGDPAPKFVLRGCCSCTHPAAGTQRATPAIRNGAKAAAGCGPRTGQQDHHARGSPPRSVWGSGTDGRRGAVCLSVCPPNPNPSACRHCQTAPGTHPDGSAGATQQEGASSEHEAPNPAHTPSPFCTPQPLPTPPVWVHSPTGACLSFPQQSGARLTSPPCPSSAPPAGGGCLGQAKWVNGRGSATQIPLRRPSWGCVMVRASPWQCPHSPPVSPSSPPQAQPRGEGGQPQPQPPPRAPTGPGPCRGPQLHLVRPLSC